MRTDWSFRSSATRRKDENNRSVLMHSVARPLPTSHSINTSPVTLPEFRSAILGGDFDPVTESGVSKDYTSFSTATRTGAVVNIIQFICECAFGT